MIRNYNGVKNRKAILYLRTLCEIKSENMESLSEALKKEGVVSFYSYDMNQLITFKSEEEISKYLQKTFFEEVNRYFRTERIRKDYFILFLVKFLNAKHQFGNWGLGIWAKRQRKGMRLLIPLC